MNNNTNQKTVEYSPINRLYFIMQNGKVLAWVKSTGKNAEAKALALAAQ